MVVLHYGPIKKKKKKKKKNLISGRTFGVMYDQTIFFANHQIRPHIKWAVSLVIAGDPT